MTPAMTADFATSGLTHLTAVSGANLTLLLAFLLITARWVGIRGWALRLVGVAGVVIFVGLCRTEPSVLRAAAMGLVALAALGSGGRRAGLRNLCLATVILIMIDPFLSRSVGFTLSVLASAGIIGWAPGWTVRLRRWMPRVFAESLAVPLAAHLATLPVVAAISGQVSVVGVLANAAAGPLVPPATVLGFLAAGLSLLERHAGRMRRFRSGLVGAGDHLDRVAGRSAAGRIVALAGVTPGADVARRFLTGRGARHESGAPPPVACCCLGVGADRRPAGGAGAARLAATPLGPGRL